MALLVSDILTRVRDQHPAFHRSRVPDAVLLRGLDNYQGTLLSKCLLRDGSYLAQQASVVIAVQSGTPGAGTSAGFPVDVGNDGTVSRVDPPTGSLKEMDITTATTLVADFVPSSSTSNSVTNNGASWTTNQYQNDYLAVIAGTGENQIRQIASNTGTVLTLSSAFTTALDSSSVVRVVSMTSSVSQSVGVVTAFPTTTTRQGYVLKLDANDVAYLDLTQPLVGTFDKGIPLPSFKTVLGGTVRFTDGQSPSQFTLTTYAQRFDPPPGGLGGWGGVYCGYVQGRQLYLIGTQEDWTDVESIDLRYVPEPPSLTAVTDYFLLPDQAASCLIAQGAIIAGQRVQGLEGLPPVDLGILGQNVLSAEQMYLSEIAAQARTTVTRMPEAW